MSPSALVPTDDDELTLSSDTLQALKSFYAEQLEQQQKMQQLMEQAEQDRLDRERASDSAVESDAPAVDVSIDLFQEDWQVHLV
jgi:23S rRNA G2445 N2-methylase RlmL